MDHPTNKLFGGKKTTYLREKYSKIELNTAQLDSEWKQTLSKVILIGTSTGGPNALQTVLTKLPEKIPAPIVIVQHMPSGFTKSLANRLDSIAKIRVKEAEHGEILQNGTAYIAPGGYHLSLKTSGNRIMIQLESAKENCILCPSVDVLFQSATNLKNIGKIVVVMTGMGSDGAKGLKELKKSGSVIAIAESQETCVVFGMPKAAIATNLIDEIENVENIAQSIMKYL